MDATDTMQRLAEARRAEDIETDNTAEAEIALMGTAEFATLTQAKARLAEARAEVSRLNAQARAEALAAYTSTGNRHPWPGVTVKLFTVVRYDAGRALEWCKAHAERYLTLNAKAFEKGAEVLRDLGAPVEIESEARAQIATDLSEWLAEELEPIAR